MLKLKFQYFLHLMQRANSLEKSLMLGKIEGMTEDEIFGWYSQLNGHEFEQTRGKDREVKDREAWHAIVIGLQRVGPDLETEQ